MTATPCRRRGRRCTGRDCDLYPWAEAKVDPGNADRGPLLLISGEQDHTVLWASPTPPTSSRRTLAESPRIMEIRGHSLTTDNGWREVADTALAFIKRFDT